MTKTHDKNQSVLSGINAGAPGDVLKNWLEFGIEGMRAEGASGGCLSGEITVTDAIGDEYDVRLHACIDKRERVMQ